MKNQNKVIELLDQMKIEYELVKHQEIFTMEEGEMLNIPHEESIAKNLFLRDDRKENFYIVTIKKNKKVNLTDLKNKLNSRKLTFASVELLDSILGLKQGSVTPLGVLNDQTKKVKIIIDETYKKENFIGIHPNQSDATIYLKMTDLEKVIKQNKTEYQFMNFREEQ